MTTQEQYRIRECNGFFTIQKKRFIKQFRMFRPSKIVEQWENVDSQGFIVDYTSYPIHHRTVAQYEKLHLAQTAMQQFIEGVKYHYPSDKKPNNSGLPIMKNPPPPPPTFPKDRIAKRN